MTIATAHSARVEDRIIDVLLREPRASFRQLAAEAEVNEATARSHVLRMTADGTLEFRGHAHPLAVPNGILVSATMTYESVDLIDVDLPVLQRSPWIARDSLAPVVFVELRAPSADELGPLVDELATVPGVEHVHIATSYRLHAGPGSIGGEAAETGHWGPVSEVRIDELDRRILGILSTDGRASYTDVGRHVGLSVQAARRRVLNLTQSGVLRFATYVQQDRRVFHHALMHCSVRSSHRASFIDEFARTPGVASVAEVTSEHPFLAELRTDTAEQLAALVRRLKAMDGVLDAQVEPILVLRDQRYW